MQALFSGKAKKKIRGKNKMVYSVQEIIYLWESAGIFDVVLPFLLIFAVVFGILSYMRIFGDNKGIHTVIALAIGILAVRNPFFTEFYKEIFPRLGVGVSIILTLMILIGMFIEGKQITYWFYGIAAIGVIIFLGILLNSFRDLGWTWTGSFSDDTITMIITIVLIIGFILAVVLSSVKSKGTIGHAFEGLFGPRT